jgi:hypothetical protein
MVYDVVRFATGRMKAEWPEWVFLHSLPKFEACNRGVILSFFAHAFKCFLEGGLPGLFVSDTLSAIVHKSQPSLRD